MPAFAESGQNITSPDQSGKSDITATVEASNFDITVPLGLPLYLHADGSVTTATDTKIENNSQGPVIVKNVKLTSADNWKLASFTDNYKTKKVNSNELGFQIMNENVLVDGSVDMQAEDWPSIPGNGNIPLNYDGKVPVRSSDGTMIAANLELTFDWDKNKLNIYPSSFYLSKNSKKQLEIMSVTETNDNITFNTSDSNVAIVDSNGIVTGVGPGSAIITAKSGDIEDVTTVTVLNLSVSATEGGTASISLNTSNPDNITLGATAYNGYHFKNWTDKDNNVLSTDVLYDTNIVKNSNFIANFEKEKTTEPSNPENPDEEYNVSLTADEGGSIEGNGTYKKGSIITIKAIPSEGYEFLKWSDNDVNSTREITIDHNINLTAYFNKVEIHNYVLAKDSDFIWKKGAYPYYNRYYWQYVGTDEYVEIPDKINGEDVTDAIFMFYRTSVKGVKSLDNEITNTSGMFQESKASTLDLSQFNTSKVTDMSLMFKSVGASDIKFGNIDTSNVTNMSDMFSLSETLNLDLSNFDTSKVTDMSNMFNDSKATNINLNSIDTSNVENMYAMFEKSKALKLDLHNFNTSKVINMREMFCESAATTLNLSSFNTSNVTDMNRMFVGSQATVLNLSNFNTSKVTDMGIMFSYSKTKNLDLSSFNTLNVKDMSYMFGNCEADNINLSSFNTLNTTDMFRMFYQCETNILDLSSFNMSKKPDIDDMFKEAKAIIGYARTQSDANILNASENKPSVLNFIVK